MKIKNFKSVEGVGDNPRGLFLFLVWQRGGRTSEMVFLFFFFQSSGVVIVVARIGGLFRNVQGEYICKKAEILFIRRSTGGQTKP